MVIEFDAAKDAKNIAKHGISLARTADLDFAAGITKPVFKNGEAREVIIAPIGARLYVVVITRRADVVRPMSLRKANSRERKRYAKG